MRRQSSLPRCCILHKMTHLHFQALILLFLLQVVPGCRGSSGTATVLAAKEDDVSLMCLDSNVTDQKHLRARCLKYDTERRTTVISEWPKKSQGGKRGTVKVDENGQFCLFLKSLQISDAGFYSCEIWEGWETVHVKNISLKVKGCRILQAVKAAPQTSVELNCQMNTTSGLQRPVKISWERLRGTTVVPVDSVRVEKNSTLLVFPSVTSSDSGWYRCTLGQTRRCFEINLQVTDNYVATTVPVTAAPTTQQELMVTESLQINGTELSSETLAPVVVSVVIGILILVASTSLFIYRRHKTRREAQEEPRQPAGCLIDSLDAYENLTLPHLSNSGNRVNSLYQFQEESVHTFQY